MNKIYKVVWNKARNCYVVASEFAKNRVCQEFCVNRFNKQHRIAA